MNPSINRAVHYVARGSADGKFGRACRAAVVTEVTTTGGPIGLCVINPTGLFFHSVADGGVQQDEDTRAGGTWHWPERVE